MHSSTDHGGSEIPHGHPRDGRRTFPVQLFFYDVNDLIICKVNPIQATWLSSWWQRRKSLLPVGTNQSLARDERGHLVATSYFFLCKGSHMNLISSLVIFLGVPQFRQVSIIKPMTCSYTFNWHCWAVSYIACSCCHCGFRSRRFSCRRKLDSFA